MADTEILPPPEPYHQASFLAFHNFDQIVALADSSNSLPPQFVLPAAERPTVAHDQYLPHLQLPLFDLAAYHSCHDEHERRAMVLLLSAACQAWGFFQLVNHGVPIELLRRMELLGHIFFELPATVKKRTSLYKDGFDQAGPKQRWFEVISLPTPFTGTTAELMKKVWPEGNEEFSNCVQKYGAALEIIARTVVMILTEGLGIDPTTFLQHLNEHGADMIRFNYYPPCPKPSIALGQTAHTDLNVLTFLYQDAVGGLQVRGTDGNWLAVKPKAEAFVVNVGDCWRVWSNCRYRAAEHRAVLNGMKPRLSFGFFCAPRRDAVIESAEELVDEEHPLHFKKGFKYGDYFEARRVMKAPNSLEIFLGMATS